MDSIHTSNIKDDTKMNQHQHVMILLKKEQAVSRGQGPSIYAPYCTSSEPASKYPGMARFRTQFDTA